MPRPTLLWLAIAVLTIASPLIRADADEDTEAPARGGVRRGFMDGSIDIDDLSERRKAAILSWLTVRDGRMRSREERRHAAAERRGENPEPLPERPPIEDMTIEEIVAEVKELARAELKLAEEAAADAQDKLDDAEADPDASVKEVEDAKVEVEEADVALDEAQEDVVIAEEVEDVVEDIDITVADEDAVDEATYVDDPLAADEADLVAADVAMEEADETLLADEVANEDVMVADEEEEMAGEVEEEDVMEEEPDVTVGGDCGTAACAIPPVAKMLDESYDPSTVDWAGVLRTMMDIGQREPRVCSFVLRTHFHDGGSWAGGLDDAGADASLIIDDRETFMDLNTQANFAPYARAVLSHMVDFYKVSASDMLGLFANMCPEAMAGDDFGGVSPLFDNQINVAVWVGKLDKSDDVEAAELQRLHADIPTEFDSMPRFIDFWNTKMNSEEQSENSEIGNPNFSGREIMALMGAHTLMDNQGCNEEECGGAKKSLTWNSDWFKDMSSGTCTPRTPPPADANGIPTSLDGGKGRLPSAAQRETMRQCGYKSAAGLELADDIMCQVDEMRGGPEDVGRQSGYDFMFVDWVPDADSRASCCGELCETCSGSDDTWFCEGSEAGTAFWPYTWADCEMKYAFNAHNNGGYCSSSHAHGADCSGFDTSPDEMDEFMEGLEKAFGCDGPCEDGRSIEEQTTVTRFAGSLNRWEHYLNKGLQRLGRIGATWGPNAMLLRPMVECGENTVCEGDPMPVPSGVCPAIAGIFGG